MRKTQFLLGVFLLSVLGNLAGCARTKSHYDAHATVTPVNASSPWLTHSQISTADLGKLRWIVGTWRGTGGVVEPFFERYQFDDEYTLTVETFADQTLKKVDDVSRFVLMDGQFGHSEGGSGSIATAVDDNSITFAPIGKGNSFRWERGSDDSWKAILNWTDKTGAAKERVYNMQRWPAKKP
jgi:hypothetical protein